MTGGGECREPNCNHAGQETQRYAMCMQVEDEGHKKVGRHVTFGDLPVKKTQSQGLRKRENKNRFEELAKVEHEANDARLPTVSLKPNPSVWE